MKRIIKNAVYACSYCNEQFNTPKEASKHEDICKHRPSLALREYEFQLRKERAEAIEKMYQTETITELDKLWYEFIKTYHKSPYSYSSFNTNVSLLNDKHYAEFNGYRLDVRPGRYSDVNHQIDMSLKKFPKIVEKIEKLQQVEKEYKDNYETQWKRIDEKELELQLADEEHQNNLKTFKELTEKMEILNKELKDIRQKLDISRDEKHKQAKESVQYIDYNSIIKKLKSDLGLK